MHINRNMSAVITNNQLLRIENKLSASMERLSSGLKINQASDSPSGIAISNKMKAQIDALDKAESNASDAVSVLQIADGALNEVASILQRMRELSVQAANGTNSYSDRESIQAEIDELKKEVDRISRDTEYNTKTLLDGSSDIRIYATGATRVTATDAVTAQVYKMNVKAAAEKATVELDYTSPQEDGLLTINGVGVKVISGMDKDEYLNEVRKAAEEAGCTVELDENAGKMLVKSDFYGVDEAIEFTVSKELAKEMQLGDGEEDYTVVAQGKDAVVELLGDNTTPEGIKLRESTGFTSTTTVTAEGNKVEIKDNNGFSISFLLDEDYEAPADSDYSVGNFEVEVTEIGALTIQIGANEHQDMDLRISEVSVESLYIDTVDVKKVKGADRAMSALDNAMAQLSAIRSRIGAFQNRLEYASTSLAATEENMTAAYSGILDTDMAEEMAEYTQQNVLNQAAISVLAQANELPQKVLSLLQ